MSHPSWISDEEVKAATRSAEDGDGLPMARMFRKIPIKDLADVLSWLAGEDGEGDFRWGQIVAALSLVSRVHDEKRRRLARNREWSKTWKKERAERAEQSRRAEREQEKLKSEENAKKQLHDHQTSAWRAVDPKIRERMKKVAALLYSPVQGESEAARRRLIEMIARHASGVDSDWLWRELLAP